MNFEDSEDVLSGGCTSCIYYQRWSNHWCTKYNKSLIMGLSGCDSWETSDPEKRIEEKGW